MFRRAGLDSRKSNSGIGLEKPGSRVLPVKIINQQEEKKNG